MAIEWYVRQGDEVQGPLSSSRLKQMADEDEITTATQVKEGSQGPWVAAGTIQDLFMPGGSGRHKTRPAHPAPGPAAAPSSVPSSTPSSSPVGEPTQQPATCGQQPAEPAQQPAPGGQAGGEEPAPLPGDDTPCWHVQTADGGRYGPATKAQLDDWVAQRRVGGSCLLWRPGWDQWKPAPAIYPQLAQPEPAPTPAQAQAAAPSGPAAADAAAQEPHTVGMAAAATATGLGAPASSGPESLVGQTLDRYEVLGLLGSGHLGAVYKARHATLDRLMALRVLPGSQDAHFLERFRSEFRAAAALVHPNIVPIHDVGQEGGRTYIAMELLEGGSLADVLRRGGHLGVGPALENMKQVAAALAAAHAAGVVHRDVKPSNILLDAAGRAKLSDFSLAVRPGTAAGAAPGGGVPEAVLYASPELLRGQAPDASSDLYSLGATFYHLLAGRPALEGQTAAEVRQKHLTTEPRPLAEVAPGVPSSLCRVVDRLLARSPAARLRSAAELQAALGQVMVPLSVPPKSPHPTVGEQPPATSPTEPAAAPKRTWFLIAALAAGLLLGLTAVVLTLVLLLGRGCRQSETPSEPGVEQTTPDQPAPGEAV